MHFQNDEELKVLSSPRAFALGAPCRSSDLKCTLLWLVIRTTTTKRLIRQGTLASIRYQVLPRGKVGKCYLAAGFRRSVLSRRAMKMRSVRGSTSAGSFHVLPL